MIGELYEHSLGGVAEVEIEHADGRRTPLPTHQWVTGRPGDDGLIGRCSGATLDIGSGPGRLTVALAERGLPALGIDITPYAVEMTRAAGGLALRRDVFGRLPGTGRWETVLLADGNIGIGGDPDALVRRVRELLRPGGRVLVEVEAPGEPGAVEWVRLAERGRPGRPGRPGGLDRPGRRGEWFRWARVGVDDMTGPAGPAVRHGLQVTERWSAGGRWFVSCSWPGVRGESWPLTVEV